MIHDSLYLIITLCVVLVPLLLCYMRPSSSKTCGQGSFSSREWHTAELALPPGVPYWTGVCASTAAIFNPEECAMVSTWQTYSSDSSQPNVLQQLHGSAVACRHAHDAHDPALVEQRLPLSGHEG